MRKLLLATTVLIALVACRKQNDLPSWENDVLVPILHTIIEPTDLIDDSLLITNGDDYYSLYWNHELFRFAVDSLVEIPDTLFNNFFKPLISMTVQPGQKILDMTRAKVFDFNGATLTELRVKSGFIQFEVINTTSERILCTYTINSATKGGAPFTFTETAPANSSVVYSTQYDFTGYNIDLKGIGQDSSNTVISNFKAWVHPNGQPVTLMTTDSFYINIHFIDLVLDYARGYFGSKFYDIGPEEMDFDVFNSIESGKLRFEQARFSLDITNSFGVDSRMKLKSLKAFNTKQGTSLSLVSPLVGKTINIERAKEVGPGMGLAQIGEFHYDLTGSNMKEIFELLPTKFEYEMMVASNPLGNISNSNDFMYYGQGLLASLNIDIPMAMIADSLTVEEPATWNFSLGDAKDNYIDGYLLATFKNSYPFDAKLTITLLDKNGIVLDTLISNALVSASNSDAQGRLISPSITHMRIHADKALVDKFEASKSFITRVVFDTSHKPNFVRFYPEHILDMTISGDFKIKWEP